VTAAVMNEITRQRQYIKCVRNSLSVVTDAVGTVVRRGPWHYISGSQNVVHEPLRVRTKICNANMAVVFKGYSAGNQITFVVNAV
jgi:hypothetical protein